MRPADSPTRLRQFLPVIAALIAALACTRLCAQVSGSVTIESDNRFRGVSLSDDNPDAHVSLAVDRPGGWYAGGSLGRAELGPDERDLQWLAYAGRSLRFSPELAWDLGATYVHFGGDASYDYPEFYAGLIAERYNAHVFVSPDYFGRQMKSLYAELNGNLPLAGALHAFAHGGLLAVTDAPDVTRRTRFDLRIGASYAARLGEAQFAFVTAGPGGPYPAAYDSRRSAWVLSLSAFF